MRNKEIKDLVFGAILMALTVLLSLLYFFNVAGLAVVTVAHIPVLIGAVLLGKKYGVLIGAVMGLTSMVFAIFTMGPNAPFTNPLLSVLPRALFGLFTYYIYVFFTKKINNRPLAIAITMGVSTFIHSLMVVPIMYFVSKWGFYFDSANHPFENDKTLFVFMLAVVSNVVFEMIIAIAVGTPIILTMDNVIKKPETN